MIYSLEIQQWQRIIPRHKSLCSILGHMNSAIFVSLGRGQVSAWGWQCLPTSQTAWALASDQVVFLQVPLHSLNGCVVESQSGEIWLLSSLPVGWELGLVRALLHLLSAFQMRSVFVMQGFVRRRAEGDPEAREVHRWGADGW